MMASSYHRKWPVVRWALCGLVGGVALGVLVTAIRGNLGNSQILVAGVLSGAGLVTVLATLLASLRNFVRGAM
jgi:hypothetical protein